jgi:hypothetical protein
MPNIYTNILVIDPVAHTVLDKWPWPVAMDGMSWADIVETFTSVYGVNHPRSARRLTGEGPYLYLRNWHPSYDPTHQSGTVDVQDVDVFLPEEIEGPTSTSYRGRLVADWRRQDDAYRLYGGRWLRQRPAVHNGRVYLIERVGTRLAGLYGEVDVADLVVNAYDREGNLLGVYDPTEHFAPCYPPTIPVVIAYPYVVWAHAGGVDLYLVEYVITDAGQQGARHWLIRCNSSLQQQQQILLEETTVDAWRPLQLNSSYYLDAFPGLNGRLGVLHTLDPRHYTPPDAYADVDKIGLYAPGGDWQYRTTASGGALGSSVCQVGNTLYGIVQRNGAWGYSPAPPTPPVYCDLRAVDIPTGQLLWSLPVTWFDGRVDYQQLHRPISGPVYHGHAYDLAYVPETGRLYVLYQTYLNQDLLPQISVTLTANPGRIARGESSRLTWVSGNAETVVSSNFGAQTVSGDATVSPATTRQYTITVGNAAGGQATSSTWVEVEVPPDEVPWITAISAPIDPLTGVHHYLTVSDAGEVQYRQSPIGGTLSAPVQVGTGVGCQLNIRPDGSLLAAIKAADHSITHRLSRDHGHTWGDT